MLIETKHKTLSHHKSRIRDFSAYYKKYLALLKRVLNVDKDFFLILVPLLATLVTPPPPAKQKVSARTTKNNQPIKVTEQSKTSKSEGKTDKKVRDIPSRKITPPTRNVKIDETKKGLSK